MCFILGLRLPLNHSKIQIPSANPSGLTKNKIKRIINIKRQLVVESRFSSKICIQKETVLPLGGFFHAVITYDT